MMPFGGWVWHNWVALVVLAGACVGTARVVSAPQETDRNVRSLPETSAGQNRGGTAAPLEIRSDMIELNRLVLRSVARDPFRPDRARSMGRYRTPAQAAAAAAMAATAPPPGPSMMPEFRPPPPPQATIVLRGVAADGKGRAIVAVDINGQSRLMRVGEEFEGHRLLSAGQGEAQFRGPTGPRTVRLGS